MKMAEIYHDNPKALEVPRWKYLLTLCVAGVGLTGIMGFAGWPWKLYNDIPSLMGYMSLALIIYKESSRLTGCWSGLTVFHTNGIWYTCWSLTSYFIISGIMHRLLWYSCCVCFCHIVQL